MYVTWAPARSNSARFAGSHFSTADHHAIAISYVDKNRQKVHLFRLSWVRYPLLYRKLFA